MLNFVQNWSVLYTDVIRFSVTPVQRRELFYSIKRGIGTMELNTPKQVQTQETKQRIYKAACDIMKKKGFSYMTVSNICKVANVSNGTFFYHFKTKEELFTHFNYEQFAEFRNKNKFDQSVKDLPFDRQIITFYDYWADYMEQVGIEFFSSYYNTKNYSLDVRIWNSRQPVFIWNYPGEVLSRAKKEGLLKDDVAVDHSAEVFATIMKGIAFDWCLSKGAFDMHERIEEILGPYLASISK